MSRAWWLGLLTLVSAALLAVTLHGRAQVPTPLTPVHIASDAVAIRILFGRSDIGPHSWNGSLTVTDGTLLRLSSWRFRQPDRFTGPSSWELSTRAAPRRAGAPRRNGARVPVVPNGVVATLQATANTVVHVTTPAGSFDFRPADITVSSPGVFLQGQASADRLAASFQVTQSPTEDDFPAAAAAPDGALWVAYIAYHHGDTNLPFTQAMKTQPANFDFLKPRGNGDQLRLARISPDGAAASWSAVGDITSGREDIYRPAVAVDGAGAVWTVWSQGVAGNWDLYGRRYQNGAFSPIQRLSTNPGPDLHAALITDRRGAVWLAWQGFRDGQSDIFMQSVASGSERWSTPMRISESPQNDWDPALAAAPDGSVYVAWDTYDKGDYDVLMKRIAEGRPGDVIPVAATARFEARPSLAVDPENRVWVAWEEAPEGWGKDFGYYVKDKGIPLYRGHTVAARCFVDGRPFHTEGALEDALRISGVQRGSVDRPGPNAEPRFESSFPRLAIDRDGRPVLTCRRPLPDLRGPGGTTWMSFVTTYTGREWTPPALVSDSDGMLDARPALVASGKGSPLYMVLASDGRNHDASRPMQFGLYVSPISPLEPPVAAGLPALVAEAFPPPRQPAPDVTAERDAVARIRAFRTRLANQTMRPLRGDFHRHTEISWDGGSDGPIVDMFRYCLDAASHDWISTPDHDNGNGREYTWWLTQQLDDAFHTGPNFVPIFGYERSVVYPDGHRNVMFAQRGIRPLPRLQAATGRGVARDDTKMLYRYLHAFNGICASHTTATDMGTDWRDNDPEVEPIVEIYQGDRQNYEYEGAPRSPSPTNAAGGYEPAGYVWNALAKGYRLGFESSSDHISTHISYGMVYAAQPTREGILDAFRKRHCYGATDNIILDVTSGSHMMGDEFSSPTAPRIHIRAMGTAPIARLIVVKNNKVVYTDTPDKQSLDVTWMDNDAPTGVNYYYVRLEQQDGQLAWSSPMWVHAKA